MIWLIIFCMLSNISAYCAHHNEWECSFTYVTVGAKNAGYCAFSCQNDGVALHIIAFPSHLPQQSKQDLHSALKRVKCYIQQKGEMWAHDRTFTKDSAQQAVNAILTDTTSSHILISGTQEKRHLHKTQALQYLKKCRSKDLTQKPTELLQLPEE